jgi:hypothetical protein
MAGVIAHHENGEVVRVTLLDDLGHGVGERVRPKSSTATTRPKPPVRRNTRAAREAENGALMSQKTRELAKAPSAAAAKPAATPNSTSAAAKPAAGTPRPPAPPARPAAAIREEPNLVGSRAPLSKVSTGSTMPAWAAAGSQPSAEREPARAASSTGSRLQVVRDDAGNLTYGGYPVKLNSSGRACVFAQANSRTQWVPVEELERMGLGLDALDAATFLHGAGPTARDFFQGPA